MRPTMMLRRLLAAAATSTLVVAAGCGDLLEVDNPNNVNAEALVNAASATNQVNGALASLTRGAHQLIGHVSTASDELAWIGSLDGMDRLNRGFVRDPYNEFLIDATTGMSQSRFMANRTVKQLEEFKAKNTLVDPNQLALVNLYDAITYDYLANHYDDFVIGSEERIAAPSVGAAKMVTLYDSVDAAAVRGLAVAATSNTALRGALTAMKARAKFDRAIWQKLNPSGKTPADPLVADQGAADDAAAALALLGADARFNLTVVQGLGFGNCFLPSCFNSRGEIGFNPAVGTYNRTSKVLTVALQDPITKQPDPVLTALMNEFVNAPNNGAYTSLAVTGSRDMRLIIAEVALAKNDLTTFATQINALRSLNNLPGWTNGAAGMPTAREILIHERRVNLFLQGRRLNDMYRFGVTKAAWSSTADAAVCPGSEFPITDNERQANPNVANAQPSCGS
jgi:starch-binding outer membrane protein, SusD/RagB family